MKARALLSLAVLGSMAWLGPAPASAAADSRVLLGLGLSTWYDDNLLRYSDEQIALLDSGTRPERFSVESSDDPAVSPSVSLTRIDRMDSSRTRLIRLRGQGEFHHRDDTADFRSLSATWQEPVSSRNRLALWGYYTPHYYLRQLRDEDVTAPGVNPYRRAEFSLAMGSVRWSQKIGRRAAVEGGYQYEHRGYNADFSERTSNTHQGVVEYGWNRLGGRVSPSLRAGYRASKARGFDGDEVAGVPPDDADVSYHGWLGGVSAVIDLEPHRRRGFSAGLAYELAARDYTSDVAGDTYHRGRNDTNHVAEASLRWAGGGGFTARGFYRLEKNDARLGSAAPTGSEVGSYTENQVGVAVEWAKVMWRSPAASTPDTNETP